MSIKQDISADIKAAMLAGDKELVGVLRTIKSTILYAEVEAGAREEGLEEKDVVTLLQKEAKKRKESAEMYKQGGDEDRSAKELKEAEIIEKYLPAQMSDQELNALIDQAIEEVDDVFPQALGKVISRVREMSQGQADGSRIAKAVKERLAK